jgi:hypothetical protein
MQKLQTDHPIKKVIMLKNKNNKTNQLELRTSFSVGASQLLYALPTISMTRLIFYRP